MVSRHESEVAGQGYQVVAIRDAQYEELVRRLASIETTVAELKRLIQELLEQKPDQRA